ncbi:MAG: T9SS type A sorting domain-containing protein [Chitinophagaceae bacterium]
MSRKDNYLFRGFCRINIGTTILLFLVSMLSFTSSNSQSTNISGIINTYHSIVEVIPAKSAIRVGSTTGLSLFETIMIVQMKGATVNTTNNVSFGDTTALNNAGNYELNTVCGIKGDTVFLFYGILNSYTLTGKVQAVGIPNYYSAVIVDTLKAKPWDNASGTGGVLAFTVDENLTMNAPVSADGSGFNGGAYMLSNGDCSNFGAATSYYYNGNTLTPQNGAFKGESIYDFPAAQSGGRGAAANGGGGGNNHNNGGGGGANLAKAGDGGGNSSSTGCNMDIHGLGGKPLSSWNGKKIFLGGGGGAGHSNNTVSSGGGSGGGIIFIRAKNLIATNTKISANGNAGGNSVSDGAAGGGGGGTIITAITNYSGTLSIEAKGGNGGTSNDGGNLKRCYGAGGGGSGGVIYFSGNAPGATIAFTGGLAGPETGRDPACNALRAATAGSDGSTVTNYSYKSSLTPSAYCEAIPLPVGLINFTATVQSKQNVLLQWKLDKTFSDKQIVIERSSNFTSWQTVTTIENASVKTIQQFTDKTPMEGISFYRLKTISKTNAISYSSLQRVNILPLSEKFKVYPNPAKDKITIEGEFSPDAILEFYSAEGKLIFKKSITSFQHIIHINLPILNSGIYFLKIDGQVKKIMIP